MALNFEKAVDVGSVGANMAEPVAPRCLMPWQQLMIDAAGDVQPCAYRGNYTNFSKRPSLGNINETPLQEIWNGKEARHVRRCMAAGDLRGAGCTDCLAIKQAQPLQMEYDPRIFQETGEPTAFRRNIKLKQREVAAGAEQLESNPTVVYFTPSHHCNLHCTHCYQNPSRKLSVVRKEATAEVLALTPYLNDIVAGGGEPLILPLWRRFLEDYRLEENPYLRFSTTTNATILRDDVVEGLERFDRLNMIVSLDGATASTFEAVRRFSKWSDFERNARRLRELTRGRPGSAFSFNISVMKSNILELPDLVEYCRRYDAGFNYQPVVAYPWKESLRCFNDPLSESAGWKEALDGARAKLPAFFEDMKAAHERGDVFWDKSFETIYEGHVDALQGLVPWDLLEKRHHRVEASIPSWSVRHANMLRDDRLQRGSRVPVLLTIGFYPTTESGMGEPHHYAILRGGGLFTVSIPDGIYGVGVAVDEAFLAMPLEPWSYLRAEVAGGRLRFVEAWPGAVPSYYSNPAYRSRMEGLRKGLRAVLPERIVLRMIRLYMAADGLWRKATRFRKS